MMKGCDHGGRWNKQVLKNKVRCCDDEVQRKGRLTSDRMWCVCLNKKKSKLEGEGGFYISAFVRNLRSVQHSTTRKTFTV